MNPTRSDHRSPDKETETETDSPRRQIPTSGGQEQPRLSAGSRLSRGHSVGGLRSAGGAGVKWGCFRMWFMLPWVPLFSAGEICSTSARDHGCQPLMTGANRLAG